MKENLIGKLATSVLILVIAVNVFILFRIWQMMPMDSFYREKKTEYILPDGFTPEKTKVLQDESSSALSGWVVRYASRGCIFCNLDYEWERLVPVLERNNYRTILLLPNETDQFAESRVLPESAEQMAYVKMDWIKQFRFTGTPTLVIFNNKGRVLWHRTGMLQDVDYESIVKTIENNRKK